MSASKIFMFQLTHHIQIQKIDFLEDKKIYRKQNINYITKKRYSVKCPFYYNMTGILSISHGDTIKVSCARAPSYDALRSCARSI